MGKRKNRTRKLAAFVILSALLFYPLPFTLFPSGFSARAARNDAALVSTLTREGRLAVFDDAWARINDRYYDQTFHGLDWDAQRTTFRALAGSADSSQELYAVLRRMIAPLKDPHTRVFAPEEKFDWWRPRFVSVGFAVAEIGGLPTVVKVDPNSAPQRAGLRAGDVIETVNGENALALVASRIGNSSSEPSAAARFRVFAKLLDGPADTAVEVGWRNKDGKRKSARLVRFWQQRELGIRLRRERGDYAVIEIEAFTKPIAATFVRTLRENLRGTRGLIIDLRGNGGGDAEAMSDIASSFLGVGSSLGQFTDREGTSFTLSTHYKSLFTPELLAQTKLPLIVLTSERTASAAEIFVEALRVSGRATIIGTETCGCVLAVRTRHLLPDGGLLDVSEMDFETPAGQHLEGHGIKPDETISVERSDLYSRRDPAIERAIDKLKIR
ncbi:MAG TPA: S41 family peptidase [Pyrinomonadaceae bacterium]|jgi:carboxyl-terminal processing protease|nr:S41 family peptidase [Pyrinomonadaceae bacterium]